VIEHIDEHIVSKIFLRWYFTPRAVRVLAKCVAKRVKSDYDVRLNIGAKQFCQAYVDKMFFVFYRILPNGGVQFSTRKRTKSKKIHNKNDDDTVVYDKEDIPKLPEKPNQVISEDLVLRLMEGNLKLDPYYEEYQA
jgi:hypothetical protein